MRLSHNIVGYLRTVNRYHAAVLTRKSGVHVLKPEAHQPVAVLDHDDLHFRIAEDSQKRLAAAIPIGASFLHPFHRAKAVLGTAPNRMAICEQFSAPELRDSRK
ncbi:MAG: hypothetical protein DMG30_00585 [Acidobacteria bacterium]|nr:MAG: hypothetical protein DMG30_00585 [Acidobacteriota bacterium]